MQFIRNGPSVPETLLHAHEESRVVFFCGAGISRPAELPNFKGLVDRIYQQLGTKRTGIEEGAYEQGQYDNTLYLLERRFPGQGIAVRQALVESLQPNLQRTEAIETHTALLQLARNRNGRLRLVTTNYDRIFEHVIAKNKLSYDSHIAPALPVPKDRSWNGLVYLHGLLPSELDKDESALRSLIVTSGDFGLAYLRDGWAARFISELFRNFVVCFVGYGVNDLVLRYMMHALATDRLPDEAVFQTYAFVKCHSGQQRIITDAWNSMGISPIFYEPHSDSNSHLALHETLQKWAKTYRDGVFGKEAIVVDYAPANPSESTHKNDFVGRMLWALSDRSGRPAKCFAEHNPAPSLKWLDKFSEHCGENESLGRFNILPQSPPVADLRFGFLSQSAFCDSVSRLKLRKNRQTIAWDEEIYFIAQWLTRHLNNPRLILWLIGNDSLLHFHLPSLIDSNLDHYEKLLNEEKNDELNEIRANSPDAIPDEAMRALWRLFLRGRIKPPQVIDDLYGWIDRLKSEGLSASLRLELRSFLSPMISLGRCYGYDDISEKTPANRLSQIFDWKPVLAADYVQSAFSDRNAEHWKHALPALLGDFQQLLHDCLDLLREVGEADDYNDGSYVDLPSIEPHWQNRGNRDWVILIELLRDAWLAVWQTDPARATRVAMNWFDLPYPTFKRLAFFAASQDGCINSTQWFDWLLSDDHRWLWSAETQREVMRVLVLQGHNLSSFLDQIEAIILNGPPHNIFKTNPKPETWQVIVDKSVWLRLIKLEESGLKLGDVARNQLEKLSSANRSWCLHPHESEEFSIWTFGTGDPDYEEPIQIETVPLDRCDLVQWLGTDSYHHRLPSYRDNWSDTCGTEPSLCLDALSELAKEGIWLKDRWREALQVWSKAEHFQEPLWPKLASLIVNMPDDNLSDVVSSVAWWLDATAQFVDKHEKMLLDLCQRILNSPIKSNFVANEIGKPIPRSVNQAINLPIGMVTKVLLNLWLRSKPRDNDGLPADIEPLFSQICNTQFEGLRPGRLLLAARLTALFRTDQSWTERHLLPLFNWSDSLVEAQLVWEGFLWSPSLDGLLLKTLESQLIETARHYDHLSEYRRRYAEFLTRATLEYMGEKDAIDFQSAFEALPLEGLEEVATTLTDALESATVQDDYWDNRIRPFWQKMWPKSNDRRSSEIADSLVLMSIAAGERFPDAVDLIGPWLQPIEHPHYVIKLLQESELCVKYSSEVLSVFDAIIQDPPWKSQEFGECLTTISRSKSELAAEGSYQRLLKYAS